MLAISLISAALISTLSLTWSEAKISKPLIEEIGKLSSLEFAKEIRKRFGIRTFICEPGKETFRQHEGPNPEFTGINELEPDQDSLQLYCESFRSNETQEISGIFIDANLAFQPNDDLPELKRNYPVILTWTVALRESLIHEFIHYLIRNSADTIELFKVSSEEFDRFRKNYDRLVSELEDLQSAKTPDQKAISEKEKEIAKVYLPELIREFGEEMDVYRFMVEHAEGLRLSAEDRSSSLLGFSSRLQHVLSYVFDYFFPLIDSLDESVREARAFAPKLHDSLNWYLERNEENPWRLERYQEALSLLVKYQVEELKQPE